MPNDTPGGTCKSRTRKTSSEEKSLSVRLAMTILLDHGKDWSSLPELVGLIGPTNTMKIIIAFGGLTLKVPTFQRLVQSLNESSAAMAVLKGKTTREVAESHGVPEEHVKRIYEALLENRRAYRSTVKRAEEQDDLDFIHELTNDSRL